MQAYVFALTHVESDFQKWIRKQFKEDVAYTKLLGKIQSSLVGQYWIENGMIYAMDNRVYIPIGGELRRELLQETHDL